MASLVLHQPKRLFHPEAPALVPQIGEWLVVLGIQNHWKTISKTIQNSILGEIWQRKHHPQEPRERFCQRADLNSHIPSRYRELLPGVATGIQIYRTWAIELLEFSDRGKIRAISSARVKGGSTKTGVLTLVEQIILWSKEQGFWATPK